MKRIVNLLLAASLLVAMSAVAYAQEDGSVVANVPFAFSVKGKTLPAGTYRISRVDTQNSDFLLLRNLQGGEAIPLLTGLNNYAAGSSLVFHRYGDEYFLSSIRTHSGEHAVPQSKAERKLARDTSYEVTSVGGSR